jgi:hypothetical protein
VSIVRITSLSRLWNWRCLIIRLQDCFDPCEQDDRCCPGIRLKTDLVVWPTLFQYERVQYERGLCIDDGMFSPGVGFGSAQFVSEGSPGFAGIQVNALSQARHMA